MTEVSPCIGTQRSAEDGDEGRGETGHGEGAMENEQTADL